MAWIEQKPGWLDRGPGRQEKPKPARVRRREAYTVTEAARILGVDRRTIRKYLALDPEDEGPIGFEEWYRLPGGHIRIRAEAVERIMKEG